MINNSQFESLRLEYKKLRQERDDLCEKLQNVYHKLQVMVQVMVAEESEKTKIKEVIGKDKDGNLWKLAITELQYNDDGITIYVLKGA